jgi:DNA-binding NarL/FixJ family response regulator
MRGVWLEREDGERIGALFVGSRTDRQPDADDLDLLHNTTAALSERLSEVDRTTNALRRLTTEVARSLVVDQTVAADPSLAALRTRERAILELYADGMTTAEIAELLVLSEHTVRTHVKNALRRLGLHSREDAVDLVRRARVYQLV